MIDKWDERFLAMAELVRSWSKGEGSGVGAVVVSPDKRLISPGYCGLPRGIADTETRLEAEATLSYRRAMLIHAEVNAILNAGRSVEHWTLYSTRFPCHACAGIIIQAGIYRVVAPEREKDYTTSTWAGSQLEAIDSLREASVVVDQHGIFQHARDK